LCGSFLFFEFSGCRVRAYTSSLVCGASVIAGCGEIIGRKSRRDASATGLWPVCWSGRKFGCGGIFFVGCRQGRRRYLATFSGLGSAISMSAMGSGLRFRISTKIETMVGSNCMPAQRCSSAIAASGVRGFL